MSRKRGSRDRPDKLEPGWPEPYRRESSALRSGAQSRWRRIYSRNGRWPGAPGRARGTLAPDKTKRRAGRAGECCFAREAVVACALREARDARTFGGWAEAIRCLADRPASAYRARLRQARTGRLSGPHRRGGFVTRGRVRACRRAGRLAPGSFRASPARLALSATLPGPLAMFLSSSASALRLSVPPRRSTSSFAFRCRFLKFMESPESRVF